MEVFNIENLNEITNSGENKVAALGFFDGIHKAHQKIITNAVKKAKELKIKSVVITLDRSPKEYFGKTTVECLTPQNKKNELLMELGVDEVYYLTFNEILQNINAEEFIDNVLIKLNVVEVFCGYDYRFGNKGLGTPLLIENYTQGKITTNVLNEMLEDNIKISTTSLKQFIKEGKLENYNKFTGRYYMVSGTVIHGKKLGRTIGFPTANLKLHDKYLLPDSNGVYLTKTKVGDKVYKSVTNIGFNPTTDKDRTERIIETYIIDFSDDIYDKTIELYFYEFMRPELKFTSFEELKAKIMEDKEVAEKKDI